MSYLGSWKIDDLLTFPANTHRFDTGAAVDADSVPTYRVYEDETGTPLLTGSMALLDGGNTVGFYSEQITLSAANGFEKGKCYTIYITATVNSVIATTSKTFQIEAEVDANVVSDKTGYGLANGAITATVIATDAIDNDAIAANAVTEIQSGLATAASIAALNNLSAAQVNAEVVDALATDTYAEPGQGTPAATTTLAAKINYLYKAFRNRKTQTSTTLSLYADDTTTVDQKATISDNGTTYDHGEMVTGP